MSKDCCNIQNNLELNIHCEGCEDNKDKIVKVPKIIVFPFCLVFYELTFCCAGVRPDTMYVDLRDSSSQSHEGQRYIV